MFESLYWIITLVFVLVISLFYCSSIRVKTSNKKVNKAYKSLLLVSMGFCMMDCLWGIGYAYKFSNTYIFIFSTIFHMSTVIVSKYWLGFIVEYFSDVIKHKKVFYAISGILIVVQFVLVIINLFTPVIFTVENCIYKTQFLRPLAFSTQYVVFVLVGIVAVYKYIVGPNSIKHKCLYMLLFVSSPILVGFVQILFPEAPFHSIGLFMSVVTVYVTVIQKRYIESVVSNSNIDGLTGIYNRKVYELEKNNLIKHGFDSSFVVFSFDINGLKETNDEFGHEMGDELIIGSALCINNVFSKYGKVFRNGGDEFSVFAKINKDDVDKVMIELNNELDSWTGKCLSGISISYGYASKEIEGDVSLNDLIKIADGRMYYMKEEYYKNQGINKIGLNQAYEKAYENYDIILSASLTTDSFHIIQSYDTPTLKESNGVLSRFLQFYIQESDNLTIENEVLINYLRGYFASGNKYYSREFNITRKNGNLHVLFEAVKDYSYSDKHQNILLFTKTLSNSALNVDEHELVRIGKELSEK